MFGVCYYPEHWPEERWAVDAQLMREAGLELVRIGEFAWSKLEPHQGQYAWDWLDRAIETLAAAGRRVILGTPTAAPPAWLIERYPEVLRVTRDGQRLIHGARRHVNLASPTYRELSAAIVTALADRYGKHPAVYGWQIDNEFGCHDSSRCYSETSRTAFQEWLKQRYGSLAALNEAWGTVFWSQTYTDWSQIPVPLAAIPPVTGHNPALELDYRRWASDVNVAFARMQADIIRPRSPGRVITTNLSPGDDKLDWFDMAGVMDVISLDNYPHGFDSPATVALIHDLAYGFKQAPYWVMEQQCGHINWSAYNPAVAPNQVRLWTYQAWGHGASTILYFRWRACRYGQEQYHSGLLNHAAQPTRGYHEVVQTTRELAALPPLARKPASVALLFSFDDLWTHQIDPHHRDFDYWQLVKTIYTSLWTRGMAVAVVPRGTPLAPYDLVIAPAPILIDPHDTQTWQDYVAQGGTLLLTCRAGVKSHSNTWTDQPLPAGMTDLLGAEVQEWLALPPTQPVPIVDAVGHQFTAPIWADVLRATQAEVLLRYRAAPYAGMAALTVHQWGRGQALYLGVYPTPALLGKLWARLLPAAAHSLPPGVEAIPLAHGWALLNQTESPLTMPLAGTWYDLLSDQRFEDGIPLAALDVRIVQEEVTS